MGFVIREMVREDIKQVQDVAKESWHATYEGIIPREIQDNFLQAAYSNEMMERRLNSSFLYVAEVENKIVGFANFSPVNHEGQVELSAIYLSPAYQGRGIGTALLEAGVNNIANIEGIYLDVEKENTIGTAFYTAKGFTIMNEFDDNFDGHILKTVRMVLKV